VEPVVPDVKEDLKEFFRILDLREESDSGRIFAPVNISCVRAHLVGPLDEILVRLKAYANGN
jgi:hypothetical protein